MPIYEYECGACKHRLEALQKMSEAPLTECPQCHRPALNKLVSAAGFQLKGNGWYATDFKGGGKPSPAAESAPASGGADTGSTKSAGTANSTSPPSSSGSAD